MATATDPESLDGEFAKGIAAALQGDSDARAQILDAFRPYLLAVANQSMPLSLRAKHGGSDLVQETLAQAHREFAGLRFDDAGDVRAWLRTILAQSLDGLDPTLSLDDKAVRRA